MYVTVLLRQKGSLVSNEIRLPAYRDSIYTRLGRQNFLKKKKL